jgi:NADPH:quinone reductase-like Zn-dependent oxidoreductase
MKAAVIHEFGDFDVFKYEEVTTPDPRPGHVLVKILAAGINRFDHYIREGSVAPELPFPHILGADAAGEVAKLGADVAGFEVGQRVIPTPGFPTDEDEYEIRPAGTAPSFTLPGLGVPGTYAQYIEVPAHWLVADDTGLSPEEAATLPMVLATATRSVKIIGEVKAGDKVLVHSGSGGAGSMQIQVAKALGAEVASTARGDNGVRVARKAGADLVINTSNEDFVERVQAWSGGGADVVIDNLGGGQLAKSIDAARPLGVIVAFGFSAGTEATFNVQSFFFGQKKLRGSMASDIEDLKWGLEQVKAGRIKPILDRTLPLHEAAQAHKLIANNQIKGNLVLLPWAA